MAQVTTHFENQEDETPMKTITFIIDEIDAKNSSIMTTLRDLGTFCAKLTGDQRYAPVKDISPPINKDTEDPVLPRLQHTLSEASEIDHALESLVRFLTQSL